MMMMKTYKVNSAAAAREAAHYSSVDGAQAMANNALSLPPSVNFYGDGDRSTGGSGVFNSSAGISMAKKFGKVVRYRIKNNARC